MQWSTTVRIHWVPSSWISENFMDFRRKSSSLYAHFVFYPNQTFEGKAVEQCEYVREKLQAIFAENNVEYVICAQLFECYKQCGYKNDDVRCVLAVSPNNQTGRFPAEKCYSQPEPRDCFTTNNHIHILVNAPSTIAALDVDSKQGTSAETAEKMEAVPFKKSKMTKEEEEGDNEEVRAGQSNEHISSTRGPLKTENTIGAKKHGSQEVFIGMRKFLDEETCGTNEFFPTKENTVNWRLEGIVRLIQDFFRLNLKMKRELGSFSVQQRTVWCPYPIISSSMSCMNDGLTMVKGNTFQTKMMEERKRQSADYANRELYTKRSPKLRAKVLWDFHCVWGHEI